MNLPMCVSEDINVHWLMHTSIVRSIHEKLKYMECMEFIPPHISCANALLRIFSDKETLDTPYSTMQH